MEEELAWRKSNLVDNKLQPDGSSQMNVNLSS